MKNKGITMIVLVITIVVLLILAGITIGMLTNENGIIGNSKQAKEQTEIENEKEILEQVTVIVMEKEKYGNLNREKLQENLDNETGRGKTEVFLENKGFLVKFLESNRYYKIDNNQDVEGPIDVIVDKTPGVLDGEGTETSPFIVMSIEDLVFFSKQVNSKIQQYVNAYIELGKDLDFESVLSYCNYKTTDYDIYLGGDGTTEIMTQLSSQGKGFKSIGCNNAFKGTFNGKGHEIKNIYNSGLFWEVVDATIRNLSITGEITEGKQQLGGVIGRATNVTIENCTNRINMSDNYSYKGGILGRGLGTINIYNCSNYGNISGMLGVGGIIGYLDGNTILNIENCINNGNIIANTRFAGGILGSIGDVGGSATSNTKIINCINNGEISGYNINGGIVGATNTSESASVIIEKCMNTNTVSCSFRNSGGILGNAVLGVQIKYCYNKGLISGNFNFSGQISGCYEGKANGVVFTNNYYNPNGDLKGISTVEDIAGQINMIEKEYNTIEELFNEMQTT